MKSSSESSNLDLLRTLAVLFVAVYHLLLFFQYTTVGPFDLHALGHFGVLLFFVHTSLVLMFSLERQVNRGQNSFFAAFYLRRCLRILPLSVFVVLAVDQFGFPVGHLHNGIFSAVDLNHSGLLANLLLYQNITHTDSVIAVLWSLPYEMQMYLLLPFLFLLARRSEKLYVTVGLWLATVALGTLSQHFPHLPDFFIYAPCFMAGVVAYQVAQTHASRWPFYTWPAVLGLATIFYLQTPGLRHGWLCCLLVGAAVPLFREMKSRWFRKSLQQVARYSYGIYLTHFVCIWFAFVALAHLPIAARWLVFGVTFVALPVAVYHLIEAPMIDFCGRLLNRQSAKQHQAIAHA